MTRCATLVIATVFSALAFVQYTGTAASQDGWITLFDGKNLDQWEAAPTDAVTYAIEDGSVVAHKKDPKATVNLVSKQSFKDFELRAEFWVSDDANSGIYIRCTTRPASAARPPTRSTSTTPGPIRATAPARSRMSPKL